MPEMKPIATFVVVREDVCVQWQSNTAALDVVLIIDVSRIDHSDEMLALWSTSQ